MYPTKAVGIYKVLQPSSPFKNIGELISQAVYPLASKVDLSPPLGNDEVSDSPFIKSLPENFAILVPSELIEMKDSCFSAVNSVKG